MTPEELIRLELPMDMETDEIIETITQRVVEQLEETMERELTETDLPEGEGKLKAYAKKIATMLAARGLFEILSMTVEAAVKMFDRSRDQPHYDDEVRGQLAEKLDDQLDIGKPFEDLCSAVPAFAAGEARQHLSRALIDSYIDVVSGQISEGSS